MARAGRDGTAFRTIIGTVTITSAAPAGGFPVSVTTSDGTIAAGPGNNSVTVPVGATSASFAIDTNKVATPTPVTFTARQRGDAPVRARAIFVR